MREAAAAHTVAGGSRRKQRSIAAWAKRLWPLYRQETVSVVPGVVQTASGRTLSEDAPGSAPCSASSPPASSHHTDRTGSLGKLRRHSGEECFEQLLDKAAAIPDPFEQAFFAFVQLPYLQPFPDVNKRVSRLAANLPLVRENLCPLSFVDVPTQAYVDGLLGVYELNRVALLRDVFCWAYERSCARCSVVRQSLGEPDPFRLRHRELIAETIGAVVSRRMGRKAAGVHIRRRAMEALPSEEGSRFIELVETDLLNLHDGNLARARLSPAEYSAWKAGWR